MLSFKIWIFVSIFLTIYGESVLDTENVMDIENIFDTENVLDTDVDICDKSGREVCNPKGERMEFPENIEALDKTCKVIIPRLSCFVNHENQCGPDDEKPIDFKIEKIQELVLDICDKNSELHRDLSKHLGCLNGIKDVRKHCQPIVEKTLDAIRSKMPQEGDQERHQKKFWCIYEMLDYSCYTAYIGVACGDDARDMVDNIQERIGLIDAVCEADVREEVKEMVTVIQAEIQDKLAIAELF